jgi:diguanylate cyclase (GGDEF)-like protein/PAS domain S-box-containing protein
MADGQVPFEGDSAVYRTLLESTKAIPWKIDWRTMRFTYIGPQIEALLGWRQNSWITVEDWAMRIHPEDRERVVNFCVSQSKAGVDHEADYRALTRDNGYVWIRDVVHVSRDARGEVEALVGFMFDISERKKAEEQLLALQKELEALSFQDGLTGVANRRRFEATLDVEWASARRRQLPLSLILLDVDHFKQYNDRHGHVQGDECLKRMAHALSLAVKRPRDLVARIGGEEFVLLLPETELDAAERVAERCRAAIAELRLPHGATAAAPFVTASLGVGTVHPAGNAEPTQFIAAVDKLLYGAKKAGRDRAACAAILLETDDGPLRAEDASDAGREPSASDESGAEASANRDAETRISDTGCDV